jgi:hypothetical protein
VFFPLLGSPLDSDRDTWFEVLLRYSCRECGGTTKIFLLRVRETPTTRPAGEAWKLTEWPAFGPRTPSRAISLIGPDKDLYLKGRRAESEGLGIGAMAYYRRIVETHKNRILQEMIRVGQRTGHSMDAIAKLEEAKDETQFSKAVDMVKDAIPPQLLIKGHNPLTLLHGALSQHLHEKTDEECLEIAGAVRTILFDLAERIGEALKDEEELNNALSRLLNPSI